MSGLRLLADDLTGALDTAAELVAAMGPISAFWHGAIPSVLPPNAALDSGTRELDTDSATAVVTSLAGTLQGAAIAYKKIDSLLRGPTLAEIVACVRAGPWSRAVLAPAFPYQGRITRGGVQYARDPQGRLCAVAGDLVASLRAEGVPAQTGRIDSAFQPGISVFDAESDDDLRRIAALGRAAPGPILWIGAGGLAQALAHGKPAEAGSALPMPILGLFGSDQAATAAQLALCGPHWIRLCDGGPTEVAVLLAQLRADGRALVSVDLSHGPSRDEAAWQIGAALRRLVQNLPAPGTLLVAGGETLRGLCQSLAARSLEIQGRIMPGLPRSVLRGGRWDGVTVVSKSGAFGKPNLLRDLLRRSQPAAERTI